MIKGHNKSKKTTALLTAAAMIVQLFVFTAPVFALPVKNISNLRDVSQNHWFYNYVKRLYENGIIQGISENSYAPDAEVKTSEAAAMIIRYLGNEHLAEKSRAVKQKNKIEGADLWYSGYIQIMCDMGIFTSYDIESYGLVLAPSGSASIPKAAAKAIEAPIKRMDIIKYIARSFEIGAGKIKANNPVKREIGGRGYEFINGGGYDEKIFEKIVPMIFDYENIPDEYVPYFLKCYYNGIIRGNEKGEVLPYDNLKRSELAKIIAAVTYFDLRGYDMREIPGVCVVNDSDYALSPAGGSKFLKTEKANSIISEQIKYAAVSVNETSVNITVTRNGIIPAGFYFEAYIYRYDKNESVEIGRLNGSTDTNPYFPKENAFTFLKTGRDVLGCIYCVLRDLKTNGDIAGAVIFEIGSSGTLTEKSAYYLP